MSFYEDMLNERKKREESQMTLGKLIDVLQKMPADFQVLNFRNPHCYRGYYSDLAFELPDGTRSAADLLDECRETIGGEFTGWKGGEYIMSENTPIWLAKEDCLGERLIFMGEDGSAKTEKEVW